jgi:hypothetical protein
VVLIVTSRVVPPAGEPASAPEETSEVLDDGRDEGAA